MLTIFQNLNDVVHLNQACVNSIVVQMWFFFTSVPVVPLISRAVEGFCMNFSHQKSILFYIFCCFFKFYLKLRNCIKFLAYDFYPSLLFERTEFWVFPKIMAYQIFMKSIYPASWSVLANFCRAFQALFLFSCQLFFKKFKKRLESGCIWSQKLLYWLKWWSIIMAC
jgi:hypothetical protein